MARAGAVSRPVVPALRREEVWYSRRHSPAEACSAAEGIRHQDAADSSDLARQETRGPRRLDRRGDLGAVAQRRLRHLCNLLSASEAARGGFASATRFHRNQPEAITSTPSVPKLPDHLYADIAGPGPEAALAHGDRRWQRDGQRIAS